MPILAIKVPFFLKENIPNGIFTQVDEINGYEEKNLHISLAVIDYDSNNKSLSDALINKIQPLLSSFPDKIILDSFTSVSKYNYGMPVKKITNEKLEELYNAIKAAIIELQDQYGKSVITLKEWKPYQAHVSFFGQVTESLTISDKDWRGSEFFPTQVMLRDNDKIIYNFQLNEMVTLKKTDEFFQLALAKHLDLIKNYSNDAILEIRNKYQTAETYYKSLDNTIGRIRCLIGLGRLNTLQCDKTYYHKSNKSTIYTENSEEEMQFRLRSIEYAIEIVRSLNSLSEDELYKFKHASNFLKDVNAYLRNNRTLFNTIKNNKNYSKLINEAMLVGADEKIDSGLKKMGQLNRNMPVITSKIGLFNSNHALDDDAILLRTSLVGDRGAGTRHLIDRYINGEYNELYFVLATDFVFKKLKTNDGKKVTSMIWYHGDEDTLERNRGTKFSASFSNAYIVCFDITNRTSFDHAEKLVANIMNKKSFSDENKTIILAGTKSDLVDEQVVTKDMMEATRKKFNIDACIICSAKTGENVNSVFELANAFCLEKRNARIDKRIKLN